MGNTILLGDGFVSITGIDSDWDFRDTFPINDHPGINVEFIGFAAGTDGDKLSLKQGSDTGPEIFPTQASKVQGPPQMVYYRGKTLKPYLDFDKGTFTTGAQVIIMFK